MTDDGVTFDLERSDTPDAVAMQDAFVGEIAVRYPQRGGQPGQTVPPVDPEAMVPPDGAWIVLRRDGRPVGCGGLRRIDAETCEIKRVYLAPEARGSGLSRRLMAHLHERALGLGYRVVRLDTGSAQPEAYRLYSALGYREIEDYNGNGLASFWFEREL
jgi:GNAT superfamily N-acetyltransferase